MCVERVCGVTCAATAPVAFQIDLDTVVEEEEEPIDWTQVAFGPPDKVILDAQDLHVFQTSPFYRRYMLFLRDLNRAVVGVRNTEDVPVSHVMQGVVAMLDEMNAWIDEIPPIDQPMRFGNKAFRAWHQRLEQKATKFVREWLPEPLSDAADEIAPYLEDSFGNATRLDYGTGHETNFMVAVYALHTLGVVEAADYKAIVLRAFAAYTRVVRRLQRVYWLEPAGSHGAWSLDDYMFLPFMFGSAQLVGHPVVKPKSVANDDVLSSYSQDYMYLDAVRHVLTYKTGPFGEVAPILFSLTRVVGWRKLNSGMTKMYQGEVLGKVPIMQHMLFGRIVQFPTVES